MSYRTFVAMPAYRDQELPASLQDLFAKAKSPGDLCVVVAWQFGQGETLPNEIRRTRR